MQLQQFQSMQGVKVIDENSDMHGKAGHVVGWSDNQQTIVQVKMDEDNAIHDFSNDQIQVL